MSILTVGGKVVLADGKPIIPPQGGELPQQEKSVTITKNGQTSVTPDDGKTLSKVDVTVAVPSDAKPEQTKTAHITANGTTKVLPDSGKVLSEVDVYVAVPSDAKAEEEKTVSITENGTTEITPTSGKVLSKATVNVNVPQPDIGQLSVTANGTYTAGKDVDAWNKVTVNVPQSGGGTVTPVDPSDITFIDYDGTVVAAWTLAELASKTALPDYPAHDGLTCQGWNWTLADLQTLARKMDVGAMYITEDEKTRVYIHLEKGRTSPMLGCCPNGTVTVDWGDGTEPDTLTGTNTASTKWTPTHNYAEPGDYIITLTVSGNVGFGGSTTANQYAYMLRQSSGTDGRNMHYLGCIRRIEFGSGVSINSRALMYCSGLRSVTIPRNATTIVGSVTFQNCASLEHVTFPDDTTTCGSDILRACSSLKTVSFPKKIKAIDAASFLGDTLLQKIRLPEAMTTISSNTFYQCYALTEIPIPASVASISGSAFMYAYGVRVYDFSKHTAVPTLANTNAFTGIAKDCEIRVPASLVDTWKAATNWATYADRIVGV